jgi:hypothetical protein
MEMDFDIQGKIIYFDFNVIVYILNKRHQDFPLEVTEYVSSIANIIYSPAHIEELEVGYRSEDKSWVEAENTAARELKYLSILTGNYAIAPYRRNSMNIISKLGDLGAHFHYERPVECRWRVAEHYDRNEYAEIGHKGFVDRAFDLPGQARIVANKDPVNEILGTEAAREEIMRDFREQFDIGLSVFQGRGLSFSMRRDIVKIRDGRWLNDPRNCFDKIKKVHIAVEAMIDITMKYLIKSKFFPDKTEKSRSGMHDITHAIYASYCDYFVVNDERFFKRCSAIYKFLGAPVKIMRMTDFIEACQKQINKNQSPL